MLISTHSPFLLSDVLPQQVTRLDMDGRGYCVIKNNTRKPYFGANIHTILADGFFLNYTIGEFARTYLQDRLDWLKALLKKRTLSDEDKNEIRSLKTVIPLIGDSIIRKSFEMLLHQVEAHYDQD